MPRFAVPPAQWVQLVQAMVARELVDGVGLPGRRAAELLGIAPSGVSQYLSGKRGGGPLGQLSTDPEARAIARDVARSIVQRPSGAPPPVRSILEAAGALHERFSGFLAASLESLPAARPQQELAGVLRKRISAEQASVSECMHLAQKARDELTRALFRHIAADSLRHAEIVASLATYLDRGISQTLASGITPGDVERMIERETEAEQGTGVYLDRSMGGVMGLLAKSMEADERKHGELLRELLEIGFKHGSGKDSTGKTGQVRRKATSPRDSSDMPAHRPDEASRASSR